MTNETLRLFTQLFREVRLACVQEKPVKDEPFAVTLRALNGEDTRAAVWLRYCAETLRELVLAKSPAVYDLADAVHNAAALEGLADGCLWLPQGYWDAEIQPFRDQYGQGYFERFVGDVHPDCTAYPQDMEVCLKLTPAWRRDSPCRQ